MSVYVCFAFVAAQDVLSDEALAFQLLDVATVLLTYCGPKAADNSESSAVIVDLIATLGFYCSNNARNQVSWNIHTIVLITISPH